MPTNKQRRQAAQRRLQRQLERRAEQAKKRRRNLLVGVSVITVLVVGGIAWLITGISGSDDSTAAAAGSSTSAAPSTPAANERAGQTTTAGPCTYTYGAQASAGKAVDAPSGDIPVTGTVGLTMTSSAGPIGLTLVRDTAPCAVASFESLARQGYFDGTPCHRETDSEGLKVLQCGDPTGTGTGGPGYTYPTQVAGTETYPRGTLAMANSGQGTDESQFFLVYGDSQLPPDYTVIGTIDEAGLGVLDGIAAGGNDGSNGPGDGAPNTPVTIESMAVLS